MLRYLAFYWNPADVQAGRLAQELGQALVRTSTSWTRVPGIGQLALYVRASRFSCYGTHLLGTSGGAVVGLLFDRDNPQRSSVRCGTAAFFDPDEVDRVVRSGGRRLVEAYWGRYVAFVCDLPAASTRILRDPVGDIQCYRAHVGGLCVYFSALPDFLTLKCLRLSVNWEHLAVRMLTGDGWADESALNEVETLRPGECVVHYPTHTKRQYYWHGFEIARSNLIDDPEIARESLRSVTKACAEAWASLHTSFVHILSGGLDSSIALACLADTSYRPRISCINFRTRDPDSDERAFARLAAARAGCELSEVERPPFRQLERIFQCSPTVGPWNLVMRGLEVQPLVTQYARERAATAVSGGDGGDALFFRGWPQLAVTDYARQRGLTGALIKMVLAAALPAQTSALKLFCDAVRYGILRRPWDIRRVIFEHYHLAGDAVIDSARKQLDLLNPGKYPSADLPPGKRLHAYNATRPSLFRDPLPQPPELDFINPLVSQPVLELVLRIPTYLHAAEGNDRVVARAAFAPDLPPEITLRTWKGGADRQQKDMISNNLELVRELLLDGALVKAGILNRERLEAALSGLPSSSTVHSTELFSYFCTEAWLMQWASDNPIHAAA